MRKPCLESMMRRTKRRASEMLRCDDGVVDSVSGMRSRRRSSSPFQPPTALAACVEGLVNT